MDIGKVLNEWHSMHQRVDIDDVVRHWTGRVECGICGYSWVAMVPVEDDQIEPIISITCPECEHQAGHPE